LTGFREKSYNLPRPAPRIAIRGEILSEVIITSNDNFDQALKKFNKMVQQTGILAEARRREHYEPPSVQRKKKAAAKRRKSLKNSQRG
jgi:small subunit ribosomal protein S21